MHWLEKFRDYEVEVLYLTDNNVYKDRGRLHDFGDGWIELHKGGGVAEQFLIPTTAIRLLKILSPATEKIENRLLRPAETVPPGDQADKRRELEIQ